MQVNKEGLKIIEWFFFFCCISCACSMIYVTEFTNLPNKYVLKLLFFSASLFFWALAILVRGYRILGKRR
jgi:hypothetical protein